MGRLETDSIKLNQRERAVRSISRRSLTKLLNCYQPEKFSINRAAHVVGSLIHAANIANPHIRAHALEDRLFRLAVVEALQDSEIRTEVLVERDAYPSVATRLKQPSDELKRALQNLGRSASARNGPSRVGQKLAALAAWFVLG